MAAPDQGFANDDLQELKSHLLELKFAYSVVPARRSQRKVNKSLKTNPAPLSDTKEAIIEKVESDLDAIASSIFNQGKHSNFRLPASKASTDLYNKLKQIRDCDRDCTEEDNNQVTSLLISFVREIDPNHPLLAEPQEDSLKADATDVEDASQHRQQRMRFENYNVNEMLDSLGIADDGDDGDLGMEDDEVRDPDYQDEMRGGSEAPTQAAE